MSTKKMSLRFYQHLGKLFYAIAAVDKQVKPVEFDKLKELVKNEWLQVDAVEDVYHSDAAYQIEIVFDGLREKKRGNPNAYFDAFVSYKREQPQCFTAEIKQLILKTAKAVAAAFSGVNKSEWILLSKLDIELKK